jgi:hypothetical protein
VQVVFKTLPVGRETTVAETCAMICQKFGLAPASHFALCEASLVVRLDRTGEQIEEHS